MEKVLEIEESENRSQSAPQATATITSSATAAQATATTTTTNTATAVQVKTGTGKPEITKHEESKEATTKSKAEKKPGKFDASKENKSKGIILFVFTSLYLFYPRKKVNGLMHC
jgi:hypothetical protein